MNMTLAPENRNAYQEAIRHVDTAMDYMIRTANQWLARTEIAIDGMGQWTPPVEGTPPDLRPQEVTAGTLPSFPPPDPTMLGEVGELNIPAWEDMRGLIEDFEPYDPGPFEPTSGLPNIPKPPAPLDTSAAPSRPELNDVEVPVEPDLSLPAAPGLDEITIPAMPTIEIPEFEVDEIPVFDAPVPDLSFNWQEQTYDPLAVNELAATIKGLLSGDMAMPKVVQDALWAAASEREDATARAAVEQAADTWAARGYDMPPGMMVEQVNAAQEQAALAKNAHSRDVFTKAAEWAIENLRMAVAQGIALETMWSQHWQQTAQRAFEAARVALDVVKDQFDLQATAFNLKMQSLTARREVFESLLRAELAKLEILRGQLEAEQLKGTLNEQKVRIYASRLDGVRVLADVFARRLEGAKVQSDMERNKIEIYKTDVDAWGEALRAEKTRFDAYDSQVRGEATKAQAYEAEARAYSATVSAASDRNNAKLRMVETKLGATDASVRKFLGLLQAETATVAARRDGIAARAQAYAADTERWGAQMRYAGQAEEIKIRAQEASVRNNIAYFEVVSRQFDARMQRMMQAAMAIRDSMEAAGQMSAQMVAGAMSAVSASASISGSGSESNSHSRSVSYNYGGEIADSGAPLG